jgi:hypothetical protein
MSGPEKFTPLSPQRPMHRIGRQTERFARSEAVLQTSSSEPKPLSAYSKDQKISDLLDATQTEVLWQTTLFIFKDQ